MGDILDKFFWYCIHHREISCQIDFKKTLIRRFLSPNYPFYWHARFPKSPKACDLAHKYATFLPNIYRLHTSRTRDINFPRERYQLPTWGMLTSLMEKMDISPANAPFLPWKERFWMGNPLFSVYLDYTYFCISLFMRKIRIFVRKFPLASANGWKYAILGFRKVQSVKKRVQAYLEEHPCLTVYNYRQLTGVL